MVVFASCQIMTNRFAFKIKIKVYGYNLTAHFTTTTFRSQIKNVINHEQNMCRPCSQISITGDNFNIMYKWMSTKLRPLH